MLVSVLELKIISLERIGLERRGGDNERLFFCREFLYECSNGGFSCLPDFLGICSAVDGL